MQLKEILDRKKNILITGGLGFIGCNLIRSLLINSDVNIFNIDKVGYASNPNSINNLLRENPKYNSRYKFFKENLTNKEEIKKIIKQSKPDLIMHLAAESHVDKSIKSPLDFINSNILGTFNLLEEARDFYDNLEGDKKNNFRFHHISTDEVFGSTNDNRFIEESPYKPNSPYSASKASSDHLVRAWNKTYGLPTIITNCSNNYGPWQFHEKLIPLTIYKAINNKNIPLYGDGSNIRDWIFIDDHVEALIIAAIKGKNGSTYCIGSENEKTNKEVIESICGLLDQIFVKDFPHSKLIKYVEDRPGHDKRYAINPTKINKELGWFPKHSFEEGLKKTVLWYVKNIKSN